MGQVNVPLLSQCSLQNEELSRNARELSPASVQPVVETYPPGGAAVVVLGAAPVAAAEGVDCVVGRIVAAAAPVPLEVAPTVPVDAAPTVPEEVDAAVPVDVVAAVAVDAAPPLAVEVAALAPPPATGRPGSVTSM
jgi:hypothetical protein